MKDGKELQKGCRTMPKAKSKTCIKIWFTANPRPKKDGLSSLSSSFEPQRYVASPLLRGSYRFVQEPASGMKYNSDEVSPEAAGSSDGGLRKSREASQRFHGGPSAEWSWYFVARPK